MHYTHNLTHCRRSSRRVRELWWLGLPPGVRGKVWKKAIGNDLNISPGELPAITWESMTMHFCVRIVSDLLDSLLGETGHCTQQI